MRNKAILFFTCTALLIAIVMLANGIREAMATGGAFYSTKHGGWAPAAEGYTPPGVDRSLGGEVGFYYDNANAGQYAPGECNHCHDLHGSFGTTTLILNAPPPEALGTDSTTNTVDPYLLMADSTSASNKNKLCWYCHNNMTLGSPPQPMGYGYWGFYQSEADYIVSSHGISANFLWPGAASLQNPGVWPRSVNRSTITNDRNKCINCHTPHGYIGTSPDTGVAPAAANYSVATAADSTVIDRQLVAREEALCLNCHDGTPAWAGTSLVTPNVKTQVDLIYDVAAPSGSAHPVRTYYNNHDLALDKAGMFTVAANRHSECVDCHNPHVARGRGTAMVAPFYGFSFQRSNNTVEVGFNNTFNTNRYVTPGNSTSSPVLVPPVVDGALGVVVSDITAGTISGVKQLTSTDYLYQLCLKCHSYWAWGATNTGPATGNAPWNSFSTIQATVTTKWNDLGTFVRNGGGAGLPMTNIAWEFATNRVAYHPVFAAGKNTPEASGVRNPCWCGPYGVGNITCPPTVASYATQGTYGDGLCAAGGGDAGGTGPAIGSRADTAVKGTSREATLSQAFVPPWLHTSRITCIDCHGDSNEDNTTAAPRGVHGSNRPFILRGVDANIQYSVCDTPACATPTTVGYSNAGSTVNLNLGTNDPNNMCLNCHRADVYGYAGTAAAPYKFSRVDHTNLDNDTPARIFVTGKPQPNGIVCMQCHGAADNTLGLIHGNDRTATNCGGLCSNSGRLLAINGAAMADNGEWSAYTKAFVGTAGACFKSGNASYCAHAGATGWSTITALYNY